MEDRTDWLFLYSFSQFSPAATGRTVAKRGDRKKKKKPPKYPAMPRATYVVSGFRHRRSGSGVWLEFYRYG